MKKGVKGIGKLSMSQFTSSISRTALKCEGNMSLIMRKQAFCVCENKDADQLRGNREADQRVKLFVFATLIV